MGTPATTEEFLHVLQKSSLLDEKTLSAFLEPRRSQLPDRPRELAVMLIQAGHLTSFQAEQLLQGKFQGFAIGPYRVLERLGAGGMSAVYLCREPDSPRLVAVKVLAAAYVRDPVCLKRFQREARASATLDHPHIVRGLLASQEGDVHFIVMEHVDGISLQDLVKDHGPLSPVRAAHYIQQAARGLQYAFEQGLVHRDIKPANLLVDRNGLVKILDLGLARFDAEEDSVLTKQVLGTLDYLAPEQRVDSHGVDIRADIFSLGSTFYYLLTGTPPRGKQHIGANTSGSQLYLPVPIQMVRPDVPEGMARIIGRMMFPNPDRRYATPGEVAQELTPWTRSAIAPPPELEKRGVGEAYRTTSEANSPNEPREASAPRRESFLRRKAFWVAALGLPLLAGVVLLMWFFFFP